MESKTERFLEIAHNSEGQKASNSRLLNKEEYDKLLNRLIELSTSDSVKKTRDDYKIQNNYSVLQFENVKVLEKNRGTMLNTTSTFIEWLRDYAWFV